MSSIHNESKQIGREVERERERERETVGASEKRRVSGEQK